MKLKKEGGELLQIDIEEVSVVDAPANKRKFLFLKSDLEKAEVDVRLQSDGTLEGTKLTVNGKEIEDLKAFYFNYFKPDNDEELYIDPVSCSYTVASDAENGFETSYHLSKAEGNTMDYAKLIAFIKALTAKDVTEAQLKKLDQEAIDSLNILSQYEGQMPADLSKAVGHFLKDLDAEPAAEEETDPPANKYSDEEMAALKTALDAIAEIIGGKKEDGKEPTGAEAILEKLKAITARIGKLEKGEDPKPGEKPEGTDADPDPDPGVAKILEALKGIEDRLQVVEKSAGVARQAEETGGAGADEVVDHYKSVPL